MDGLSIVQPVSRYIPSMTVHVLVMRTDDCCTYFRCLVGELYSCISFIPAISLCLGVPSAMCGLPDTGTPGASARLESRRCGSVPVIFLLPR